MNANTKPAIGFAAQAASVLEAALRYADCGLSVIPCVGKRASLASWAAFQSRRASAMLIQQWHDAGRLHNVAIVCGQVSRGNHVVIDLDGDEAVFDFYEAFPHYRNTFTVMSGSGHGRHLYFQCARAISTTKTNTERGGYELRSDGAYVVAPPSCHPDTGNRYYVFNDSPIMQLETMQPIREWIGAMRKVESATLLSRQEVQQLRSTHHYGAAALRDETNKVRFAPVGLRNDQLNRSAFKLGKLVYRGVLSRSDAEAGLYAAAMSLAADDGDGSVLRTIKSGLDAGSNPATWKA